MKYDLRAIMMNYDHWTIIMKYNHRAINLMYIREVQYIFINLETLELNFSPYNYKDVQKRDTLQIEV